MLSHAQTTFQATTVSALTGTKALSRANCPLLMGSEAAFFRADDGLTAQNPPSGEYFNLFVVCSWMQVMELCL